MKLLKLAESCDKLQVQEKAGFMQYQKRIEIQRLFREEGLDARAIAEKLDEPESTVRYHIKHPPQLRQPLPEPPPRLYLPEPQPRAYLPPAPIHAQPQDYIDAEWWEETMPQRNHNPRRALPSRDEAGRFIPRGSEPTAMARREQPQAIQQRRAYDPNDSTIVFEALSGLFRWIGRKLFGNAHQIEPQSQRDRPQHLLTTGHQPINWHDQMQWNDPAIYGNNAQQIYGNNLTPERSDYYTCNHCRQLHLIGYGCPWNGYR